MDDSLPPIDEVSSLTVPKLKAELTKLNQPVGGLKRKAQLVEALTAYIEQRQQQQPSSGTAGAQEAENTPEATAATSTPAAAPAPAAVARPVEENAAEEQEVQPQEKPAHEEPVDPDAEPMDVAADNGSDAAAADVPAQQEAATAAVAPVAGNGGIAAANAPAEEGEESTTPVVEPLTPAMATKSPAKTPASIGRKRTARADDDGVEATRDEPNPSGGGADDEGQAGEDGADEQQPKRKQLPFVSPAAKRKKGSDGIAAAVEPEQVAEEAAEAADVADESAPPRQEKEQAQPKDEGKKAKGNGSAKTEEGAAALAGDAMDEEKEAAPSSEPARGADTSAPDTAAGAAAFAADDAEKEGGEEGDEMEEAVDPVTIRVDNFVRPFTAPQAKKLLEDKAEAPILEGGFWMDSIKTHCYATFGGKEAAERAIDALQGLQWPAQSFKRLEAKMGDISAEEARAREDAKRTNRPYPGKERPTRILGPRVMPVEAKSPPGGGSSGQANGSAAQAASTTPEPSAAATGVRVRGRGSVQAPGVTGSRRGVLAANVEEEVGRSRRQPEAGAGGDQQKEVEEEPIVLEEIFRKTEAKPSLYWLPLSEEEVGQRKKKMEEDGVGPRTTPMDADQIEAAVGGGGRGNGGGRDGGGWGGGRKGSGGGGPAPSRQGGYGGGGMGYYGRGGVGGRRR